MTGFYCPSFIPLVSLRVMKIILAVLSPLLTLIIGNTQSTEERVEWLFDQAYEQLDSNPDSSYYFAETASAIAERSNLEWHQANAKFIQGYIYGYY